MSNVIFLASGRQKTSIKKKTARFFAFLSEKPLVSIGVPDLYFAWLGHGLIYFLNLISL